MEIHHPETLEMWDVATSTLHGNLNAVMEFNKVNFDKAKARVRRIENQQTTLFRKVQSGLDQQILAVLYLLIWAVVNCISRYALNDHLLDSFFQLIGATAVPNRHTLQDVYLPLLDDCVAKCLNKLVIDIKSVSMCSDGWSDRQRRNWINYTLHFIHVTETKWELVVLHPDLSILINVEILKFKLFRSREEHPNFVSGSFQTRFAWVFESQSLALAARMFLPGPKKFEFQNFNVDEDTLDIVRDNIRFEIRQLAKDESPATINYACDSLTMIAESLEAIPATERRTRWCGGPNKFVSSQPGMWPRCIYRYLLLQLNANAAGVALAFYCRLFAPH
eukprot:TRINITY_DN1131_c0_g2_i11.p1 TRINITY_DN1131_c0_g2~~TRINITY_DN1131_c0_g2_i11.p1  ORF type:complete len:334 (-),score=21.85 TRINITY_DN1131_c0_g2_i11:221-1222(-)